MKSYYLYTFECFCVGSWYGYIYSVFLIVDILFFSWYGSCTFTVKLMYYFILLEVPFYNNRCISKNCFLFKCTYTNYKDFPNVTDHFCLSQLFFTISSSNIKFLSWTFLGPNFPVLKRDSLSSHYRITFLKGDFLFSFFLFFLLYFICPSLLICNWWINIYT